MPANTLETAKLQVKQFIPASESKYGKPSIVVDSGGKNEYLGLNTAVEKTVFEEGVTYDLELSISAKNGKRYVNRVLSTGEKSPVPVTTFDKDRTNGQRQGAIGHFASRMVAALIMAGHVQDSDTALAEFNKLVDGISKDFA